MLLPIKNKLGEKPKNNNQAGSQIFFSIWKTIFKIRINLSQQAALAINFF